MTKSKIHIVVLLLKELEFVFLRLAFYHLKSLTGICKMHLLKQAC